jgi:hypothetical protein
MHRGLAGFHIQKASGANDDGLLRKRGRLRQTRTEATERENHRIPIAVERHSVPQKTSVVLGPVPYNVQDGSGNLD